MKQDLNKTKYEITEQEFKKAQESLQMASEKYRKELGMGCELPSNI